MALTSWKAFKFFNVSQVKFPDADSSSLFEQGHITSITTGADNVFSGSSDGVVRILSRAFKVVRSFKAHDSGAITQMKQLKNTSLLVTVAEDLSNEPVLKVWALDKAEKKTGIPRCLSTLDIRNGRKQFPISAFATLENLSQLAVGFANGAVTVIRGDLVNDLGTRQRVVFESDEPVTGIEFREGSITTLYIATTNRILTLVISGKGQGQPARSLDEIGCAVGCMAVDKTTNDLVVARDDAMYYYGLHGRGPNYPYECPKKLVSIFRDYVIVVSTPQTRPSSATTSLRMFGGGAADKILDTCNVTVLDVDLKVIAHQETLSSPVSTIFSEWDSIFVLTLDGKVFRYREKSFQQKLDLMYQRSLYVLAINLAQKVGADENQQNVIFRKYGDYLYIKGDFDTAMQQYLKAIENTEASQVIRKYLDTQRIHNLIQYLEELHEHQRATSDHTTLLLNCYAKLKDVEKLEEFIKSPGDLKFDLDTAITMCRQGEYFDQAAFLARKHNEHDIVVDVLIEDCKKYAEAMAYIWRLEPAFAYRNLMKYATVLLEHCSADALQFFIDYYTGQFRPKKDAVVVVHAPAARPMVRAATAVQNLAALLPLPYMSTGSIQTPSDDPNTVTQMQVVETTTDEAPANYDIPRPRSAFSSFIDHPSEFVAFLEACANKEGTSEDDLKDLNTNLFEMYIQTAGGKEGQEKAKWEQKAKQLIEDKKIPMDASNVLLLSHLGDFRDGTIMIREQQGMRFDIFRSYTSAKDTTGAIKALHKYGPEEPQLYTAALSYFTSSPKVMQEAGDELQKVLDKIDEDGLMAPLQVVQMLSENGVATVGMVKKYLRTTMERERNETATNRRLTETFRADAAAKRAELAELAAKPVTFTATRCASCGAGLDLPTVHFMCKHSFHQRCLDTAAFAASTTVNRNNNNNNNKSTRGRNSRRRRGQHRNHRIHQHSDSQSIDGNDDSDDGGESDEDEEEGEDEENPDEDSDDGDDDDDYDDDDINDIECPVCAPQNATVRAIRRAQNESAHRHDMFLDVLGRSKDGFGTVSEWFGRGVMNK